MRGRKPSQIAADAGALTAVPSAPSWLSKDAKAEWRRVMPDLVRRRVVTTSDLGSVENYCTVNGRIRELDRAFQSGDIDPKLLRLQAMLVQTARQLATELGLTPVSRSKPQAVAAEKQAEDSPLDM